MQTQITINEFDLEDFTLRFAARKLAHSVRIQKVRVREEVQSNLKENGDMKAFLTKRELTGCVKKTKQAARNLHYLFLRNPGMSRVKAFPILIEIEHCSAILNSINLWMVEDQEIKVGFSVTQVEIRR